MLLCKVNLLLLFDSEGVIMKLLNRVETKLSLI
jgi:hypothetical protein